MLHGNNQKESEVVDLTRDIEERYSKKMKDSSRIVFVSRLFFPVFVTLLVEILYFPVSSLFSALFLSAPVKTRRTETQITEMA